MHKGEMIRAVLAAFEGKIYQKHTAPVYRYVRELSYPTTTKIYIFNKTTGI
jgi:hypothetical protein